MPADGSMRLVYVAPVPWGSFSQRPHRFVHWFHERFGAEVLWVNPYPTRLARLSDVWRLVRSQKEPPRQGQHWLQERAVAALPVEPIWGLRRTNALVWRKTLAAIREFTHKQPACICIGKPSLFALACLDAAPLAVSIYDMMDDFPAFYSGWSRAQVCQSEREIVRRATHVAYSSQQLRKRCLEQRTDAIATPNGLDSQTDWLARSPRAPGAAPVYGYVGTMASWFDWAWVRLLAQTQPHARIELHGPLYGTAPMGMPGNVRIHGPVSHAHAVDLMRGFDVGIVPFLQNALTASVDPIKYYEYRALGMGIMSTPFGEMALRGGEPGVFLSDCNAEQIRSAAAQALAHAQTHRLETNTTAQFVREHSWESRFDLLGLDARLPRPWPEAPWRIGARGALAGVGPKALSAAG